MMIWGKRNQIYITEQAQYIVNGVVRGKGTNGEGGCFTYLKCIMGIALNNSYGCDQLLRGKKKREGKLQIKLHVIYIQEYISFFLFRMGFHFMLPTTVNYSYLIVFYSLYYVSNCQRAVYFILPSISSTASPTPSKGHQGFKFEGKTFQCVIFIYSPTPFNF